MTMAAKSAGLNGQELATPLFVDNAELFRLSASTRSPILALGPDSKSTLCLYRGSQAIVSRWMGDLTNPADYRTFCGMVGQLMTSPQRPELIAHDLHPGFLSTRFARELGLPTIAVQHHHAHICSVLAEHNVFEPVIGICCDGVGYGQDHASWGCEVLRCQPGEFHRMGHLEYFPLLGGDAAAIDTWRPAYALLRQAFEGHPSADASSIFLRIPPADFELLKKLAASELSLPMTSSLGRVFDAMSFLLGLCDRNTHEAQAAIALERAATDTASEAYPYETRMSADGITMSLLAAIRVVLMELNTGVSIGLIASRFHETVARMLSATAMMAAEQSGIETIAVSGGCFANKRLLDRVTQRLQQRHLRVLCPMRLSCGDAGLSLGQAVAAAAIHARAG